MEQLDRSTLARHHVLVQSDALWQQRLRLMQATWREEQGIPIGTHHSKGVEYQLGSRIAMPYAKESLSNYLTETVRRVVREELEDPPTKQRGKLFSAPRIYNDLLSSQPLAFNLFAELKADLSLASAVCRHLWPNRVREVSRIEFEHSPGRGDPTYTGNRTAFDVYVEHTRPGGGRGFIGIEVKYHENLIVGAAENRERTEEVAVNSGAFRDERLDALRRPPLQQVWFDHLLALSMLEADDWDSGLFVFLHPAVNERCYRVVEDYESTLQDAETFQRLTLEEFVAALRLHAAGDWVVNFRNRYLDYGRVG